MKVILGIETATDACSCALWCEGEVSEAFEIAPRRHTERVLPMVDSLLKQKKLRLKDVDAIAFGKGPGSFMGTRLAASIAMGLGFGTEKPLIPISSLQALAQGACHELGASHVAAGWDARMQQIYWGCYYADQKGIMQPVLADALDAPHAIVLPQNQPWVLAGNAWQVYQTELNFAAQSHLLYPHAAMVVELAAVHDDLLQKTTEVKLEYLREQVTHQR